MGPLKISDVSSQLCPQTRLFSSHTNHSPPAARLPLQLYLRLGCSLFLSLASLENYSFKIQLKCRLLEKNFINSLGSDFALFRAAIKNHYDIYMALICLPKFPQRQPRASFPKYPRLWRCPQSLCQCLRNGPTHFVKVRGWMGGQINEQTKGQLWKARKLLSPYAHMRFYKNELSLSYCLVTVTKYFQTLF